MTKATDQVTVLSREQIQALPANEVKSQYDNAVAYLDALLNEPAPQNSLKKHQQERIQAARMQYVTLRLRLFPQHFNRVVPATEMA